MRFSLAGVQLKLSMLREGLRLTLPVRGQHGDWLVKLPDSRFERVPEVEYATMRWAQAAGIDVPECELVPVSELRGATRAGTPSSSKQFRDVSVASFQQHWRRIPLAQDAG